MILRILVILAAYVICLGFSGHVVRYFVLPKEMPPPEPSKPGAPRFDTSVVIGKCENLIVLSFLLAGEVTGIALIFAAKSLVRTDAIKENPSFYLGGTMVNLCWSLGIGFVARLLCFGSL